MDLEMKLEPGDEGDFAVPELKIKVKNESGVNFVDKTNQLSAVQEVTQPVSKLQDSDTSPGTHSCPKCADIFEQESKYTDHVLTHAPWYIIYVCGICGLSLEQKNLLADHIISHVTPHKRQPGCGLNNSPDSDSDNEVLSLKVGLWSDGTKKGDYKCDECSTTFSNKSQLVEHSKCHISIPKKDEPRSDRVRTKKVKVSQEVVFSSDEDVIKAEDASDDSDYIVENPKYEKVVKRRPKSTGIRKQKKNDLKVKEYKCGFCEEVFNLRTNVRKHEAEQHKEERLHSTKVVKCPVCSLLCAKASFKGHMRIHTGERPYQCVQCGKAFANPGSLSQHKKVHVEKNFTCQLCNKSYSRKAHLKMHMWVHSGQRSFVCSTCGKTFAKSCTLKVHMRLHTGEKPHVCSVCGKGFSQRYDLVAHLVVHTGEKPFVCDKCGKAFARRVCLKTHILKLHSENKINADGTPGSPVKAHVCSTCGKAFFTRAELHQHSVVHSGLKPFECSTCGKTFARKSRLDLHTRVHTGEKPHVCETCGKSFSSRPQLRVHWVVHSGEKPHACMTCGKAFALKDRLRDHLQLHTGEKPFVCIICGKAFALVAYLHAHMKIHKGDKPHSCPTCDRAFYYKSELRKHCATMHT